MYQQVLLFVTLIRPGPHEPMCIRRCIHMHLFWSILHIVIHVVNMWTGPQTKLHKTLRQWNLSMKNIYDLLIMMPIIKGEITKHQESRTQFHENVLARTVLNAGNFLWMAKGVTYVISVSTTLWTSRWSKGKVHWVNLNIYNSVNITVKDIVEQWYFPLTSNLAKRMWLCPLADHRKWSEFKTVLDKTISCNWVWSHIHKTLLSLVGN